MIHLEESLRMNNSGLQPVGRAVLLRMIEIDELKAELVVIPDHVRRNSAVMEQRAEVIEVGAEAWADEKTPRAAAGDKVIVTKLAGYMTKGPADGKLYRLVNDRDVFCRITKESNDG